MQGRLPLPAWRRGAGQGNQSDHRNTL